MREPRVTRIDHIVLSPVESVWGQYKAPLAVSHPHLAVHHAYNNLT